MTPFKQKAEELIKKYYRGKDGVMKQALMLSIAYALEAQHKAGKLEGEKNMAQRILEGVEKNLDVNTRCSKSHETESDPWKEDVYKRNGLETAISTIKRIGKL